MTLTSAETDLIPVKNMGGEALVSGEAGVKVGDNDLRLVTSKSTKQDLFLLAIEVASLYGKSYAPNVMKYVPFVLGLRKGN